MLLINEIFFSLQGEGVTMGYPAVFLRLAECNLRCAWCDSKHAWHEGIEQEITSIVDEIKSHQVKRLIITGGEPLLQKDELDLLLQALPDWVIEIETNGTILPTAYQLARCFFNVSPKLSNAKSAEYNGNTDNNKKNGRNDLVLQTFNHQNTKAIFKFVISDTKDLDEIPKLGIDKNKIIIMPQGKNRAELKATTERIITAVIARHYRFLSRLHIELWDGRRGI